MDQVLQGSKMASAKWRKQRMQERQKQSDLLREQRQERKRRMMRYTETYSSTDEDSSRSSSPDNDSAAETPSEYSARTPDNLSSPEIEVKNQQQSQPHEPESTTPEVKVSTEETQTPAQVTTTTTRKPSKRGFGASLATPADFTYQRYSTFVQEDEFTDDEATIQAENPAEELPQQQPVETFENVDSSEYDDGDDEIQIYEVGNSPIEVATSVLYSIPRAKPLMVSVIAVKQPVLEERARSNSSSTAKSFEFPTPPPPPPPLTNQKSPDGFLACEANPVQFPSPLLHDRTASADTFSTTSETSKIDDADATIKKKSSMSMLGRFAHSRAHSIKNFIKPNPNMSAPEVPQLPIIHQKRPSTADMDKLLKTQPVSAVPSHLLEEKSPVARRSLSEPVHFQQAQLSVRPQTSHAKQRSIPIVPKQPEPIKALQPITVIDPPLKQQENESTEQIGVTRRKSFSNLRRRSGSLGQVLKLATSKSKPVVPDSPMPPMPSIVPIRRDDLVPLRMPSSSPVPKTPKSTKAGGYSPFPRTSKIGEPVGLGLKMT